MPTRSTVLTSAHIQVDTMPYDERPLPITRKQLGEASTKPEVKDADSSDVRRRGVSGEPEPLTEKALREASSAIDILGEALVKIKTKLCTCMACKCADTCRHRAQHTSTGRESENCCRGFALFNVCVCVCVYILPFTCGGLRS